MQLARGFHHLEKPLIQRVGEGLRFAAVGVREQVDSDTTRKSRALPRQQFTRHRRLEPVTIDGGIKLTTR
jgi:hypothetical protein